MSVSWFYIFKIGMLSLISKSIFENKFINREKTFRYPEHNRSSNIFRERFRLNSVNLIRDVNSCGTSKNIVSCSM